MCGWAVYIEPTPASPNQDNCNDKNSYFPKDADKCGIPGTAFCVTKPGDATEAQGQPFTFDSALSGIAKPFSCTKDGSCMFRKELIPSDFSSVKCINPNWTGVNFAASKFKAKSLYCPGRYNTDMVPPKCEPSPTGGVEACLVELCTLGLTSIKMAETHSYRCSLLQ